MAGTDFVAYFIFHVAKLEKVLGNRYIGYRYVMSKSMNLKMNNRMGFFSTHPHPHHFISNSYCIHRFMAHLCYVSGCGENIGYVRIAWTWRFQIEIMEKNICIRQILKTSLWKLNINKSIKRNSLIFSKTKFHPKEFESFIFQLINQPSFINPPNN